MTIGEKLDKNLNIWTFFVKTEPLNSKFNQSFARSVTLVVIKTSSLNTSHNISTLHSLTLLAQKLFIIDKLIKNVYLTAFGKQYNFTPKINFQMRPFYLR